MSRLKQEKRVPELEQARSKLDGVLQSLVEKTEESQSSSSQSEDESKALDSAAKDASPKKIQKTQRKRRRKDDSAVQNSNTYITKIYGCSVDLAQFDENSPLYSMCRSWIQNKPLQSSERNHGVAEIDKKKNTNDSADDDDTKGIFFLPAPVAPPKDDAGNVKDLRIPSPVPQPSEKFFMASDDSEVVPVNVLLAGHQTRWKNVRQKWKEAAMANEERYKESAAILLKAMSNDQDAPSQWESAPA
ncbi:protein lin-37 homolog isoform X1 [Dermacentor albipictus]|uniref:protein lin-37 homolog isoform X1 n=1 Tax=Dermacentor albipictus TaxID=60249 RepID=UPI0031FCF847